MAALNDLALRVPELSSLPGLCIWSGTWTFTIDVDCPAWSGDDVIEQDVAVVMIMERSERSTYMRIIVTATRSRYRSRIKGQKNNSWKAGLKDEQEVEAENILFFWAFARPWARSCSLTVS
jgi:hypothetical protein